MLFACSLVVSGRPALRNGQISQPWVANPNSLVYRIRNRTFATRGFSHGWVWQERQSGLAGNKEPWEIIDFI